MHGVPIMGDIHASNVLVGRARPAQSTFGDWMDALPVRNRLNIDRVRRSQRSPLSQDRWDKNLSEVADGWVATPSPVTDDDVAAIPLTHRFAMRDRPGQPKIRLIDEFRASGAKELVDMRDTDIPDALDAALSAATLYEWIEPGCELNALAVDFQHA